MRPGLPPSLLKQDRLQLATASFREKHRILDFLNSLGVYIQYIYIYVYVTIYARKNLIHNHSKLII